MGHVSVLAVIACSISTLLASGCASRRAPDVLRHEPTLLGTSLSPPASSTWGLENLRPEGRTVLIDGQRIPIAIDMKASGDGQYALQLSANQKQYRPFELRTQQGTGEIDFSGEISWLVKVKGKNETVIITVGLYRVEEERSKKTEVRTLLRQFKRQYDVMCNEKECAVILFFKRIFRSCRCQSPT